MLTLSDVAIIEKNKLHSDSAWIILLDIVIPGIPEPVQICRNSENITWNGSKYTAFPFELGDVTEDNKGSLPSIELKVSNVARSMQYYLEKGGGGVKSTVILRVVNSKHLDVTNPEVEELFMVTSMKVDAKWVTFKLGVGYPSGARRPLRRLLKNFCPFKYKGIECGCMSSLTTCNHNLADCRVRGNSKRFGGEPGIPSGGFYI
jgi:lambda family phage minor tail protein L